MAIFTHEGQRYSTCKTAAASLDSHNELYSNKKDRGGELVRLSLTLFSGGGKNNIRYSCWSYRAFHLSVNYSLSLGE